MPQGPGSNCISIQLHTHTLVRNSIESTLCIDRLTSPSAESNPPGQGALEQSNLDTTTYICREKSKISANNANDYNGLKRLFIGNQQFGKSRYLNSACKVNPTANGKYVLDCNLKQSGVGKNVKYHARWKRYITKGATIWPLAHVVHYFDI